MFDLFILIIIAPLQ